MRHGHINRGTESSFRVLRVSAGAQSTDVLSRVICLSPEVLIFSVGAGICLQVSSFASPVIDIVESGHDSDSGMGREVGEALGNIPDREDAIASEHGDSGASGDGIDAPAGGGGPVVLLNSEVPLVLTVEFETLEVLEGFDLQSAYSHNNLAIVVDFDYVISLVRYHETAGLSEQGKSDDCIVTVSEGQSGIVSWLGSNSE